MAERAQAEMIEIFEWSGATLAPEGGQGSPA
jgi:hypothetical protein